MGTETKPTPTLWALFSDKPTHEWQERTIIEAASGKIIAETTDIQDAAFIVRAVNSHADLIAALEAARKELVRGGHIDRWKTITIIDVTLAKAKEVTHDA